MRTGISSALTTSSISWNNWSLWSLLKIPCRRSERKNPSYLSQPQNRIQANLQVQGDWYWQQPRFIPIPLAWCTMIHSPNQPTHPKSCSFIPYNLLKICDLSCIQVIELYFVSEKSKKFRFHLRFVISWQMPLEFVKFNANCQNVIQQAPLVNCAP